MSYNLLLHKDWLLRIHYNNYRRDSLIFAIGSAKGLHLMPSVLNGTILIKSSHILICMNMEYGEFLQSQWHVFMSRITLILVVATLLSIVSTYSNKAVIRRYLDWVFFIDLFQKLWSQLSSFIPAQCTSTHP